MEGIKDKIADLKKDFSEIIDTYKQLVKVKAAEKISSFLSLFIVIFVALFLFIFFIFFIGIAASIWIGNLLDNMVAGYLIVAGVYLLLIILLFAMRKKIILPAIANTIIKKIYG